MTTTRADIWRSLLLSVILIAKSVVVLALFLIIRSTLK